jgi:BNR/Asp-box repeat.
MITSMRKLLLFIVLLVPSLGLSASRRRAVIANPFPPCSVVTGTPAVTFTRDEGRTLAALAEPLQGIAYTVGLAALDTPDTMLSLHGTLLSVSKDAGCSWSPVQSIDTRYSPPAILAARGGRAYLWSKSGLFLALYTGSGVTILKPPAAIMGLIADSQTGDRVRIGGSDGSIWESKDAGQSWALLGSLPSAIGYYCFAFDPSDLDHIVAGVAINGAFVSRDGGRSWAASTGLGNGNTNVFNVVFSPSDPRVVWVMGLDISEADANAPSEGRHIYRSTDGGSSFTPVVDQDSNVHLINGPNMAAHPANANVLYFVFGSYVLKTDIYRYDASTAKVTKTHNGYDGVDAIVFSPRDPSLMYLGLEVVIQNQP